MRRLLFLSVFAFVAVLVLFPVQTKADADNKVTGVVLNPANLQITLGERDTIYAIVYPDEARDKRVTWSVNDPRLLEISEVYQADPSADPILEIRALFPGRAVLSAVTRDGGFRAQAVIQIVVVPVRSITMIPPDLELAPGETFIIRARVEPAEGTLPFVTFESTDPAVASVNEIGLVLARQPGEARIIARSVQDDSVSAFSTVTVSAGAVAPADISEPPTTNGVAGDDEAVPGETADEGQTVEDDNFISGLLPWLAIAGLLILSFIALLLFLKGRRHPTPRETGLPGQVSGLSSAQNRQAVSFSAGILGISGSYAGQKVSFRNNRLVIGRDPSADLVYSQHNEQISRTHLTISFDPQAKLFTLVDSSANGTYLSSHERLEKGKPYQLKNGEKFYLVDPGEMFELKLN